jgi:flavin-dependent dehydrogenase
MPEGYDLIVIGGGPTGSSAAAVPAAKGAAHSHLRGDLTGGLIWHLVRDLEPLFRAVLKFADVPVPVPYGASCC